MLSKFDDYCIHQTTEPIAHPAESDRNYYDRYWFNGFDKTGNFCFEIGFGIFPNRFVMDGHFSVSMGGKQYSFHGSRRAPFDRTETTIGPMEVLVENPMKEIRVRLAPNSTGMECDLKFTARTCATQEPKNVMYDDIHLIMNTTRFTQLGHWEGFFKIDGTKTDVAFETTLGTRDKSWGVRPVGEPQGGAPGLLNQEPGVYWCWAPIHFDDFCTQFGTFEDHDGNPTQVSGCKVPAYANIQDVPVGSEPNHLEMEKAIHRIKWKKGTRHAESAEIELYPLGGDVMKIELTPLIPFQMLGIGYQHPEWGHAFWKGEEAIARETWVLSELDPMDYKHIHIHHIVKARLNDMEGVGTLETVVFGRHDPSGFKDILDPAE